MSVIMLSDLAEIKHELPSTNSVNQIKHWRKMLQLRSYT